MQMDVIDFCEMVSVGKEKEQNDRFFQQWIQFLVPMSKQELKYISFENYVEQCTGKNIDLRPAEDIIAELESLHGAKLTEGGK